MSEKVSVKHMANSTDFREPLEVRDLVCEMAARIQGLEKHIASVPDLPKRLEALEEQVKSDINLSQDVARYQLAMNKRLWALEAQVKELRGKPAIPALTDSFEWTNDPENMAKQLSRKHPSPVAPAGDPLLELEAWLKSHVFSAPVPMGTDDTKDNAWRDRMASAIRQHIEAGAEIERQHAEEAKVLKGHNEQLKKRIAELEAINSSNSKIVESIRDLCRAVGEPDCARPESPKRIMEMCIDKINNTKCQYGAKIIGEICDTQDCAIHWPKEHAQTLATVKQERDEYVERVRRMREEFHYEPMSPERRASVEATKFRIAELEQEREADRKRIAELESENARRKAGCVLTAEERKAVEAVARWMEQNGTNKNWDDDVDESYSIKDMPWYDMAKGFRKLLSGATTPIDAAVVERLTKYAEWLNQDEYSNSPYAWTTSDGDIDDGCGRASTDLRTLLQSVHPVPGMREAIRDLVSWINHHQPGCSGGDCVWCKAVVALRQIGGFDACD